MSGTSVDGLDMACCTFSSEKGKWSYHLNKSTSFTYDKNWQDRLMNAMHLNKEELNDLDLEYGRLIAAKVREFSDGLSCKPELIASHGHTIFHEPAKGITFQAGSGDLIASITGITTVSDFRKGDVELGGQGAPMVPVGDQLLFNEYSYCLNLGGFCNISYNKNGTRYAFDISPCNIILNYLSRIVGRDFDEEGRLARSGCTNTELLKELNALDYYISTGPKSLGKEWFDEVFLRVINSYSLAHKDMMRTVYDHIVVQIAGSIDEGFCDSVLLTGGGTHNTFLVNQIKTRIRCKLVIPEIQLIDFKEAIVFGFLGLLKYLGQVNCYASVTGASRDSVCGEIHY